MERKSQPIQQIRKRFRQQWLLIAVDEMNPVTMVPRRGRLLVHSPHRDEVYDEMVRRREWTLVTYSDDRLPAGYATAF